MTPGTIYKFRRTDLIAALDRVPQNVRPRSLRSLSKDDLANELLAIARALPHVAEMVEEMAQRLERPYSAGALRRFAEASLGPCGKYH
jgi:hypothetical protein